MFTFKKIAMVSAAGLAAFAMSCSDDGGDDKGADEFVGFEVSLADDGYIALSGEINALQITEVAATANDKAVEINPAPDVPSDTVSLNGRELIGVCTAINSTKADTKVSVKITATLADGTKLESSAKEVAIDCSDAGAGEEDELGRETMTLSYAGESYADLDENKKYNEAGLASDDIKKSIDIVAFAKNTAPSNVYAPSATGSMVSATFLGLSCEVDEVSGDCVEGDNQYNAYSVGIVPIADEYVASIKAAKSFEDIDEELRASIEDGSIYADWTDNAPATADEAFIVSSFENDFIVVVTETGTQSVTFTYFVL